ncbi:hypothetical protein PFISCL1PPCAC_13323, partial [Pristionchus fissidentatus]
FIHRSLNYTFIINRRLVSLERLGEAHALVADVVDLAVLADEGIAHDPRGTETERLEALDGEDARVVVSLDDHVDGAEGVGGGSDDEVESGIFALQSTVYSCQSALYTPPASAAIFSTMSLGAARSDVPVSEMTCHPLLLL